MSAGRIPRTTTNEEAKKKMGPQMWRNWFAGNNFIPINSNNASFNNFITIIIQDANLREDPDGEDHHSGDGGF